MCLENSRRAHKFIPGGGASRSDILLCVLNEDTIPGRESIDSTLSTKHPYGEKWTTSTETMSSVDGYGRWLRGRGHIVDAVEWINTL